MAPHWTNAWPEIAWRLAAPPRLLVACDFDGTLVPFVSDPGEAQLSSAALEVLRRVQAAPGVNLAILSGRSLEDIAKRIPLPEITLAGNHGLELRGLGLDGARSQAIVLRPRLEAIAQELERALGQVAGLRIENKGLSLSVHFRNVCSSRHERVANEVRRASEREGGFKLQLGKMVLDVVPDIGWDKGAAVKQISSHLGLPRCAAFYVGDDTTDESVFSALPTAITIRVGMLAKTAARWSARDPDDIRILLDWLARTRCAADKRGTMSSIRL